MRFDARNIRSKAVAGNSRLVVESLQVRFELGVDLVRILARFSGRSQSKIEFREFQTRLVIEARKFGERSLLRGFRREQAILELFQLRQRIRHETPRSR